MTLPQLLQVAAAWRVTGKTICFTNGVFDLLHEGHIFSLSEAAKEADRLIVAINSDDSVKRLKGPQRPLNNQQARALVMASLVMVDAVIIFEADTPAQLIEAIQPDVLVKGGDYKVEDIAGSDTVLSRGGRVVINPVIEGVSTTLLISRMSGEKPV